MSKNILLVDDEPLILKGLKYSLEQEGYTTDEAVDGEQAINMFREKDYDLILLDVMLPKISGVEVCQMIRETSTVPIIMLTAKGEDMDKILGLEFGADDYMTKPFNILEVKARIKAILRRASQSVPVKGNEPVPTQLTYDGLVVFPSKRSVMLDGKEIALTAKEFDLLHLFMENPGKVFTREALLENIWKYEYMGDFRTVDVHIRRLREKIERNGAKPEFILTKWGVGYYFAT